MHSHLGRDDYEQRSGEIYGGAASADLTAAPLYNPLVFVALLCGCGEVAALLLAMFSNALFSEMVRHRTAGDCGADKLSADDVDAFGSDHDDPFYDDSEVPF